MNRRDFLKAIPLLGILPFLKTFPAKMTITDSVGNQSIKFVPVHDRAVKIIASNSSYNWPVYSPGRRIENRIYYENGTIDAFAFDGSKQWQLTNEGWIEISS